VGPSLDDAAFTWVAADDLEAQKRLLREGWLGVRMREGDAALGFVRVAGAGR
jgi:hypothetical protein